MKLLAAFFSLFNNTSIIILIEDLHVRFIVDWLEKGSSTFIHKQCIWNLGEGYPHKESFTGANFLDCYTSYLALFYQEWTFTISEVIGSSIGAIVVGTFHAVDKINGQTCKAPFINFYRIRDSKIVKADYVMGKMDGAYSVHHELIDMFPVNCLPSMN